MNECEETGVHHRVEEVDIPEGVRLHLPGPSYSLCNLCGLSMPMRQLG